MADSIPPTGGSQVSTPPQKKANSPLIWWGRLANYVLLAGAVFMIADLVWEGIEEGKWKWYRFGLPLMFITMAIVNFATINMRERKLAEQGTATDASRTK